MASTCNTWRKVLSWYRNVSALFLSKKSLAELQPWVLCERVTPGGPVSSLCCGGLASLFQASWIFQVSDSSSRISDTALRRLLSGLPLKVGGAGPLRLRAGAVIYVVGEASERREKGFSAEPAAQPRQGYSIFSMVQDKYYTVMDGLIVATGVAHVLKIQSNSR